MIIFQNFEKKFKFYQKSKNSSFKNFDNYSINSRNYATAYYQTLEEVPGPQVPEKSKKLKNFFKNLKKWQKSCKTINYVYKLSSKLLSNLTGG